jgi:hypothetical protein
MDAAAPQLSRALPEGVDPVMIVRDRVRRWYDLSAPEQHPERRLIAGLLPAEDGVGDPEVRQALNERAALIEQRADALVARALAQGEPWIKRLGDPPRSTEIRLRWERAAATVAAYRDRHGVSDLVNPIGEPHGGGQWTRRTDRRGAQTAAVEARRLAREATGGTPVARATRGSDLDRVSAPDL